MEEDARTLGSEIAADHAAMKSPVRLCQMMPTVMPTGAHGGESGRLNEDDVPGFMRVCALRRTPANEKLQIWKPQVVGSNPTVGSIRNAEFKGLQGRTSESLAH